LPLLLNIDTATEHASICLSHNTDVLMMEKSLNQKDHASFLQPAIKKIFEKSRLELLSLDAIAVTAGPGSYTGLRVGLASAKGLCYALNKPLILLNTLEVMANASINQTNHSPLTTHQFLYCPMIDARRMEVFTAIYDHALNTILKPHAVILDKNSFGKYLEQYQIIFSGSGSQKFKNIIEYPNANFINIHHDATDMINLSVKSFAQQQFADVAYSEPFYIKEFFTPKRADR
jgi:tRNA threonylcarbamoyladenosine biosynthesis protein TsaB